MEENIQEGGRNNMLDDLYYRSESGKPYGGTAALLHRLFSDDVQNKSDYESELAEYKALIQKLGYAPADD